MGSGRKTCVYCGEEVPSSVYKRHVNTYHDDMIRPLSVPYRVFKLFFYINCAITLFVLSSTGVNLYGLNDFSAEIMRLFFALLSGGCVVEFTISLKKFIKKTGVRVTIEKKQELKTMNLIKKGIALGKALHSNRKGISAGGIIMAVFGTVLGIYLFAFMFPDAIYQLFNITWHADVPEGVQTLSTTIVALVGAIVFVLLLVKQVD